MKTSFRAALALGAALSFGFYVASPARAVVLENRWQAGQSLPYDLNLEGVANVQLAPDVKFFLAGVPLEIGVKGNGRAVLETISVAPDGTGTVAWDVPRMKIEAQTFGQKAVLNIANGQRTFTLGNMALGKPRPTKKADGSRLAVRISRDGRLVGIEKLTALGAPASAEKPKSTVTSEAAANRAAFITNLVLQALPSLWPGRDVKTGESWKAEVVVPPLENVTANAPKTDLNEVTLTLREREVVQGRELWRVAMKGTLGSPTTDSLRVGGVEVDEANLGVDGDLWFDAAKGRIARGEIALETRAQGRPAPANPNSTKGEASWLDFAGTVRFELAD